MANDSKRDSKLRYNGPQIVDIGDAVALTGYIGSPVRDNPLVDTPAYYDANPPKEEEIDVDD